MYFYYFVYFLKENLKKDLVICFCELFIFFEKKLWVWSFFKKLIFEMVNCIKKNWKFMILNNFCLLVYFICFSNQLLENGVCFYSVVDEKEFNREYD